ncbi:MAG: type I-E CRISPR-associated protein Cas6/Cse3/CasE [Thermosynechococcaceae cyanobacterium]
MYLSKLVLNERDRKVRSDLSNAHNLHRSIMQAFPDENRENSRADWNILFRQEPDSEVILVQSDAEIEPDWARLPQGYLVQHAVKSFDVQASQIKSSQLFQFRLKANPSKRDKASGKLIAMFHQSDQREWLERKGKQCGFSVNGINIIPTPNIFGFKAKGNSPIKIFAVLYQGILEVEDPNLLIESIRQGIGRGRSYGCGLLSIARVLRFQ